MRPVVVPPTYFKALSNYFLAHTWRLAEQVARGAKRMIFCGYSFPDADIYFKYLLKRIELNGGKRLKEVVVINDHSKKGDEERTAEWLRYRRFIHQDIELRFLKVGFAEFAADPTIIDRADVFAPKPKEQPTVSAGVSGAASPAGTTPRRMKPRRRPR
jgi:hypothetical protein